MPLPAHVLVPSAPPQLERTQKKYVVLAVKPVKLAVVTPAAVEAVGVVPAVGAVALVET